MEQILTKLSEIEIAARSVQKDADKTKQALSEKMEQQCKDFDAALEQQTNARILRIRDGLEKEKDSRLTALRQETEEHFTALDTYFEQNHQQLCEELFQKILQRQ
ncbi:MAG: hypothetical protein Q4C77_19865 [Eubacteriales bacterium]|nr:hypothetical protein [Eubacteriales bacterium]